jgi:hypothetical protein
MAGDYDWHIHWNRHATNSDSTSRIYWGDTDAARRANEHWEKAKRMVEEATRYETVYETVNTPSAWTEEDDKLFQAWLEE